MVPDLTLICENMLMAEGFIEARALASKFYSLYALCRELLSQQAHYDWGLRAIKVSLHLCAPVLKLALSASSFCRSSGTEHIIAFLEQSAVCASCSRKYEACGTYRYSGAGCTLARTP